MFPVFKRAQELMDEGKPAALATVIETQGSTPRKPGSRMIVYPDRKIEGTVGGGALENKVIDVAIKVIDEGNPELVHIDLQDDQPHSVGGVCGGKLTVFVEKIGYASRLLIFGAGHVGQTLARMAAELEIEIMVYDDREQFAVPDLFPEGVKVCHGPFDKAMETLQPKQSDYIVIMTYKHMNDRQVVKEALKTPAKYIGMIGSELKVMRVMDDLKKEGVTEDQLNRVIAPIGLNIGAHTPAEVAVSILAQVVRVMSGFPPH